MGKHTRFTLIVIGFALLLTVSSCVTSENVHDSESDTSRQSVQDNSTPKEESKSDVIRPVITIKSDGLIIYMNPAAEFDLMDGVSGRDNIDGDITEEIKVSDDGFDPNVPGEYMINYTLFDSSGNEARPQTRKIVVRDNTIFIPPDIYEGEIKDEIKHPDNPMLFGGAWYHKVVSSKDYWDGIEGTIVLPEVLLRRYDGEYDDTVNVDAGAKNLDNPSVYMGGHALSESDVGLSFSRALIDIENQTLSHGCIAFRPFWRYITKDNKDVGGYDVHDGEYAVSCNGDNCIANYHWKYTEYYYLPGDKLRMVIYIPGPNKMQLQIQVLEKSTLPESVEIREKYGWKDPADFKSPIFESPGHGTGITAEYKRVNAIDQVANEGGTAIVSDTEVNLALWENTYLYRKIDGKLYRVPLDKNRRGVLSAPDSKGFEISFDGIDRNAGGEILSIKPGNTK